MELAVTAPEKRLPVLQKMHELVVSWNGTSQTALEVVAEMKVLTAMLEAIQESVSAEERGYTKKESDLLLAIHQKQKLVHYVLQVARNRALEDLKEVNQQGKMKEYIYKQNQMRFLDKKF